jgi:hypothetical protein
MTPQEIETAMGQRLATISPEPRISWPNKDATPALPYLAFKHIPVSVEDETLDNTGRRQVGLVLVTVVAQRDSFTTGANTLAQAVADRFPRGLRLPVAGKGAILIRRWPEVVDGFHDRTGDWNVPVRISFETEET